MVKRQLLKNKEDDLKSLNNMKHLVSIPLVSNQVDKYTVYTAKLPATHTIIDFIGVNDSYELIALVPIKPRLLDVERSFMILSNTDKLRQDLPYSMYKPIATFCSGTINTISGRLYLIDVTDGVLMSEES